MSWTDVFPVFDDEYVIDYSRNCSDIEAKELSALFDVKERINVQESRHIVATSLFLKGRFKEDPAFHFLTYEKVKEAGKYGLRNKFEFWSHYVEPLIDAAKYCKFGDCDAVLRVYLARDLDFMIEDLVSVGCEIMLMEGSSLSHNPGAMWRFLAIGEKGRLVTIIDADKGREVEQYIGRTEHLNAASLGLWRIPYTFISPGKVLSPGYYRPIVACSFGVIGGLDIESLMRAFVWHSQRGSIRDYCTISNGEKSDKFLIYGAEWPTYGFDEWFLLSVVFPRLAFQGVATLLSLRASPPNYWITVDIEYVTWANRCSEIIVGGDISEYSLSDDTLLPGS